MVSTPWIRQGDFYHVMTEEDSGFETYSISALDISRISAEFLDEERKALGPFFASEYLVEWLDSDGLTYFNYDDVVGAFTDEVEPLFMVVDGERVLNPEDGAAVEQKPARNPYKDLLL